MKQKEIAQRIMAMYHALQTEEEKKHFVDLLKDIVKIIERMNEKEFAQFVDDFEKHLDQIDNMKNDIGFGD